MSASLLHRRKQLRLSLIRQRMFRKTCRRPSQVHNNLYSFLLQYYIAQNIFHNFEVISAEVKQRNAAGLSVLRQTSSHLEIYRTRTR